MEHQRVCHVRFKTGRVHVEVFWAMTPCSLEGRYRRSERHVAKLVSQVAEVGTVKVQENIAATGDVCLLGPA
jgi:hypothetical protein